MDAMKKQAENLKVETLDAEVTEITRDEHCFEVKANNVAYQTHEIIFAVGAERRRLGIPNEKELTSRGVHYCVTCDGPVYSGKTIAMAGGGDASEVKEIVGKQRLEKLLLSKPFKDSDKLVVDGLFVEIGTIPNVDLAKSLGVELDERGYIKVDNMMKTNIDGVFAAGDAVNHFGSFKQDITAAAMGSVAATSAYNDHKVHGELCPFHAMPPKVETK